MTTAAQNILAAWDYNGDYSPNRCGVYLADYLDLVEDRCPENYYERDGEDWRFQFSDGSALTGNANGWDIEGDEPFVFKGA